MNFLMVALGGAIGAGGRYLLGGWLQAQLGPEFPWGTFVINVLGSLAIGLVLGISGRGGLSPGASLFLATGVLGGFTTSRRSATRRCNSSRGARSGSRCSTDSARSSRAPPPHTWVF